jgi:hypothetical protein
MGIMLTPCQRGAIVHPWLQGVQPYTVYAAP